MLMMRLRERVERVERGEDRNWTVKPLWKLLASRYGRYRGIALVLALGQGHSPTYACIFKSVSIRKLTCITAPLSLPWRPVDLVTSLANLP